MPKKPTDLSISPTIPTSPESRDQELGARESRRRRKTGNTCERLRNNTLRRRLMRGLDPVGRLNDSGSETVQVYPTPDSRLLKECSAIVCLRGQRG